MNWALVIAAAPEERIDYIRQIYRAAPRPLVLCADGGLQKARKLGIPCDLLIGDMDSGGLEGAEGLAQLRLPAEKDFTDTQSCLEEAARRGCRAIVLAGASGGRLDHLLCNLHLLEALAERGIQGWLADQDNLVRMAPQGDLEQIAVPARFRYFSLIPLDQRLEGVTIRGAKYPLEYAAVSRADSLTVSNEPAGGPVGIQVKRGKALLIFSR